MPFSRWSRPSHRLARHFRPAVLRLEDRTVPSGFGDLFGASGPATHLQVVVPENTRAGRPTPVLVEALDASNHLASGFTGTVSLSLGTPDSGATLPAAYRFRASDHGAHVFLLTLSQTTPQTITATDTADSFMASATTNAATRVATTVVVETPEAAATGVPTRVEVEVLDQAGQLMRDFTGPVTVSSSDTTAKGSPQRRGEPASLPITYNFQRGDHGEHSFAITFNATASATGTPVTVTATSASPALSGSAQITLYPATTVTHFAGFGLPFAFVGSAVPIHVMALNASNQVVTGYAGTVSFSSSDAAALISATRTGTPVSLAGFTYTFTPTDAGQHTFWVTFGTTGRQTLKIADSLAGIADSVDIRVFNPLPFLQGH